jgi:hypothetical protein
MLQVEMHSVDIFSAPERGSEFFVALHFVFKRILISQIPYGQIYGPHNEFLRSYFMVSVARIFSNPDVRNMEVNFI